MKATIRSLSNNASTIIIRIHCSLFVQIIRYAIPVYLDTRLCFHIGTDYILTYTFTCLGYPHFEVT